MGDRATLRMAREELEDLYLGLGVPDESVDLTFKDLPCAGDGNVDKKQQQQAALVRSSTNIFAYKLQQDEQQQQQPVPDLRLSPTPSSSPNNYHQQQQRHRRRPGIPHSNICALCSSYVYQLLFRRHRCLVCGRVYCRRCVGAGMGDMTEGRKCIDCLGRRYSHRYIHRAGTNLTTTCCCFGFWAPGDAQAVKVQELFWAEKGPAPRRRPPRQSSSASISTSTSTSYAGASISMTMSINNNGFQYSTRPPVLAPPSSSFVASSSPNPHAFPL